MFAITQAQYYLTLLKYTLAFVGGTIGVIVFLAIIWAIVVYCHYWR